MPSVEWAEVVNLGAQGRGAALVKTSIVFGLLAIFLTINRLYWRAKIAHGLGWDDLFITLACVFLIFLCAVEICAVNFGYGQPADTLRPANIHAALLMFYESQIYYKCSINSSKLSVICMYMRIFRTTTQRWFMITCWCLGAIVLCYSIASIIGTIFQCTPIQYMWNRTQYHGHCISDTPFWIANAIYNIVTDAVIVASVPWVVNTLQVSKKQKFLLHCMFSLVLFTFATSIMRLTTLPPSSKAIDPVYGTLITSMWSTLEASCALISTNLPMLRHTIKSLWPRVIGTNAPNSETTSYTGDQTSQLPPNFHICANCRPGPTGIARPEQIYKQRPQPPPRPQRPDNGLGIQLTALPTHSNRPEPRQAGAAPPISPILSQNSFRRDSLLPSPPPFVLAGPSSSSSSHRRSDFRAPTPFPSLMTGTLPPQSPRHNDNAIVPAPLTPTRRDRDTTKTPSPLLARFKGKGKAKCDDIENQDGEEGRHILGDGEGEPLSHQVSNHSGDAEI